MEGRENLYIVFGGHTERITDYLKKQGYQVIGSDRTLDAAAIMAPNLDEKPDTYLVLGSALVSGVVDVGINYGAALIENLSKLRSAVPNSRIVLMLPETVEPDVIQGIIYMGIYDIHRVKQISIAQIPELLSQRKSYADYGVKTLPVPTKENSKNEIEVFNGEESKKRNSLKVLIKAIHNLIGAITGKIKRRDVNHADRVIEETKEYIRETNHVEEVPENHVEEAPEKEGQPVSPNMKDLQQGRTKVLCLGLEITSQLAEQGIEIVSDPDDAQIIISDIHGFCFAAKDKKLIVLGTGTIADFSVKTTRPDAYIAEDIEDALTLIKQSKKESPAKKESSGAIKNETKEKPSEVTENKARENPNRKPNLTVISSGRSSTNGHIISFNSALYIVCPSRPGKAGELAAGEISKRIDNSALVCAASGSMGAISLGIPAKDLICMDWRVPGSNAPVKWDDVLVWPVDPYKFLKIDESPHGLIENIKPKCDLVVADCAGELDIVSKVSNKDGIIVLCDERDSTVSYWLKNYAGDNIFAACVSGDINIVPAENGFVLTRQDGRTKKLTKASQSGRS